MPMIFIESKEALSRLTQEVLQGLADGLQAFQGATNTPVGLAINPATGHAEVEFQFTLLDGDSGINAAFEQQRQGAQATHEEAVKGAQATREERQTAPATDTEVQKQGAQEDTSTVTMQPSVSHVVDSGSTGQTTTYDYQEG